MLRQSAIRMTLIFVLVCMTVHVFAEELLPAQPPTGGISLKEIWKYNSYTDHPEVTWSPDGKWLLFGVKVNKTGKASTVIAKPDGSEIIEVADHLTDRAGWIDNQRLWYRVEVQNKDKREPTDKIIIYDIKSKKKRQIDLPHDPKSKIEAVPGREGLVYVRDGSIRLMGIKPGQAEKVLLSDLAISAEFDRFKVSRNGTTLLVSFCKDNRSSLHIIKIGTKDIHQKLITQEGTIRDFTISPDGNMVAYIILRAKVPTQRDVEAELRLVDLRIDNDVVLEKTDLSPGNDGWRHLSFSNNYKYLAYTRRFPNTSINDFHLFIRNLAAGTTSEIPQVLDSETGKRFAYFGPEISWSYDSKALAVYTYETPLQIDGTCHRPEPPHIYNGGLFILKADGTKVTFAGSQLQAYWSPAGRRLATTWGGTDLKVMDVYESGD